MKKLSLLYVALVILVLMPITVFSQNDISLVTGNVGEKYVNIKVVATDYGTSSDDNGNFKLFLPKTDKVMGLLFSCVGYYDTLVSVVPQQDTVEIRFQMRKQVYMLEAANVTADKVTHYYNKPHYVMFDFEILDDKFFILQKKINEKNDYWVLVADMVFNPIDTIFLPDYIKPSGIILDCLGNCQIVGQDSVYQIGKVDNDFAICFPSEKNRYKSIMNNILFVSNKYLYFNELKLDGYISQFYRYDIETKEKQDLFLSDDSKSFREIQREVRFHKFCMASDTNYRGPNAEEWESFVRHAWYHTKDCHLAKVADTLYYFDHLNNKIETYDEAMNLLHSCEITYPEKQNFWRYKIYQDRVLPKFYTIFGTTLNEIDVNTGKTIPRVSVNRDISNKIIIYKGNLYSLKKRRDSSNKEVSVIEKTRLN